MPAPASIGALAYAAGSDVSLAQALGNTQHIAHEAHHVVQQSQSKTKLTTKAAGTTSEGSSACDRTVDLADSIKSPIGSASKIPVPALKGLKPVSEGIIATRATCSKTSTTFQVATASLLAMAGIFAATKVLKIAFNEAAFRDAISVAEKVDKKFGADLPQEIAAESENLERAAKILLAGTGAETYKHLNNFAGHLEKISPIEDVCKAISRLEKPLKQFAQSVMAL